MMVGWDGGMMGNSGWLWMLVPLLFWGGRGMGAMMGSAAQGNADNEMPVSPKRAREIADGYLPRVSPGTRAGGAEAFYGFCTLHACNMIGMLGVNGYSGEVWYHSWHGTFVAMGE